MNHPLLTDFIRNKTIQKSFLTCLSVELLSCSSIYKTLILFGLPFLTSVLFCLRYKPGKKLIKASMQVSQQYRKNNRVC